MAIYGAIFDNQVPTAKQMGAILKPMYSDGILHGCNITYNGSNAIIAAGMMMACGRAFEITASTNVTLSGTGYARVIAKIDMSKAATADTFGQAYFAAETVSNQSSFRNLTKDNVNAAGTLYEMEVARFSISNGTITGKISQVDDLGVEAAFCKFLGENYYGTTLPSAGKAGRIFFKKITG